MFFATSHDLPRLAVSKPAAAVTPQEVAATAAIDTNVKVPSLLSPHDRMLYKEVFLAQKKADWVNADLLLPQINDQLLIGHVMADRYLHRHYDSTPGELSAWLKAYGDHFEAYDIYTLALAKSPSLKNSLPPIRKQASLQGYGDDSQFSWRSGNTALAKSWKNGLQAWRNNDKQGAAKIFMAIADTNPDDLPTGALSAAAFWSWRAQHALNNHSEAIKYLRLAATEPRSFYGILARKQMKQALGLDTEPDKFTDQDMKQLVGDPKTKRVIALTETGRSDLAERELRALFPQSDDAEKIRLLALAHRLNLASVQMIMARQLSREGQTLDYARYPIPNWKPKGGFTIDPALIYALARQESGFHTAAVSPDGAMGIMQLMPATASLMKKRIEREDSGRVLPAVAGNANEPETNVTLGQSYLQHLLDNNLVENNLFYLLAAYNAGPGRLQEWKRDIAHNDDPLLFVESIPFSETRNYIMQVMANYWIYSEMAGLPSRSVISVLGNKWPSYEQPDFLATLSRTERKAS